MKKTVLGLYLSETQAQAVLVEQNTSSNTLLAAGTWENTLFDYAGDDTPGVDDFVDQISQFLTPHRRASDLVRVSVALDSSLMFINTIPLASTVSRSEIDQQMTWELQSHFPGSPGDNFITDFHIITNPSDSDWDNVIMVSVRRDLVRKLHHALARLKFPLDIVDVDHFGAETALQYNHLDVAAKRVALVGVKPRRMDVSFIRYSDLDTYRYFVTASEEEIVSHISTMVNAEKSLAGIILYGTVSNDLATRAHAAAKIPVALLNPIRNITLSEAARSEESLTSEPHTYAVAIGAALRRD